MRERWDVQVGLLSEMYAQILGRRSIAVDLYSRVIPPHKPLWGSVRIAVGLGDWTLPQLFSQPPNITLSNYVLGGQLCTIIYIWFTSQFWWGSDRRKVQPLSPFFTIQTLL